MKEPFTNCWTAYTNIMKIIDMCERFVTMRAEKIPNSHRIPFVIDSEAVSSSGEGHHKHLIDVELFQTERCISVYIAFCTDFPYELRKGF